MSNLTEQEIERIEIHADYMDRCARNQLADILRRAAAELRESVIRDD